MDLVTVTYNGDENQMILQAESIQKFVDKCNHWVVINELDADIDYWKKLLSKYYTNHTLKLLTPDSFNSFCHHDDLPVNGWHRQQYYKLKIADIIKTKYLILDSKNFFIKPTKLSEWNTVVGCGVKNTWKDSPNDYFYKVARMYCIFFKMKIPKDYLMWATPFVIDPDVLKSSNYFNELKKYLYTPVGTSEFLFYSIIMQNHPDYINFVEQKKHFTIWDHYINDDDIKEVLYRRIKTVNVIGIHKRFINQPNHIAWVNAWLKETGFDFQF